MWYINHFFNHVEYMECIIMCVRYLRTCFPFDSIFLLKQQLVHSATPYFDSHFRISFWILFHYMTSESHATVAKWSDCKKFLQWNGHQIDRLVWNGGETIGVDMMLFTKMAYILQTKGSKAAEIQRTHAQTHIHNVIYPLKQTGSELNFSNDDGSNTMTRTKYRPFLWMHRGNTSQRISYEYAHSTRKGIAFECA